MGKAHGTNYPVTCFMLALAIGILVPAAAYAGKGPVVRASLKSGYAVAEAAGYIDGSAGEVWAVLTDYEHLADYMPSVKECRILERTGRRVRLRYKVGVSIFTVSYIAELKEVEENRRQTWRLLEGGLAENSGCWQLNPVGKNRTHLRYHVRISHKFLPDALTLRLLRSRLPDVYRAIQDKVFKNRRQGLHD